MTTPAVSTSRPMFYFACGSNLDTGQMKVCCPVAVPLGRTVLPNHALLFA